MHHLRSQPAMNKWKYSALNAEMSEFESLFDSLGNARDYPNWSVPRTWLMEDANDPGYQMIDNEIV